MVPASTTPEQPREDSGGQAERPVGTIAGEALTIDLAAAADRLRHERAWQTGDRNAITLVKSGSLRVVLTAVKRGAHIQTHHADGHTTVHVLSGKLRIQAAGQTIDLSAGNLLALAPGVAHDVAAVDESIFLVTIALQGDASADARADR